MGVDLKKSKEIVLPAYNDSQKITAEFNLNLLDRINNELGANFDRNNFEHYPDYDEEIGIARAVEYCPPNLIAFTLPLSSIYPFFVVSRFISGFLYKLLFLQ